MKLDPTGKSTPCLDYELWLAILFQARPFDPRYPREFSLYKSKVVASICLKYADAMDAAIFQRLTAKESFQCMGGLLCCDDPL